MSAENPGTKRTALILGGSQGLGLAVAEALVRSGAEVGIVGRDAASSSRAQTLLTGNPGSAETFSCDLTERGSVENLLTEVDQHFDHVDIVLLNGGGPPPLPASQFDHGAWRQLVDSMLLSQMMVATHFLPSMRERKFGRIVIVSSTSVREPIPGLTASNSLRAGLAGWAKTLSAEVARDGVTVNLVLPGRFATGRTFALERREAAGRGVDPGLLSAEKQREIPMGRYGTPEEFGAVVSFLVSDAAAYITGVALPVDGGLSRSML